MKPLIKYPGGKSKEIKKIKLYIPKHERYIEPFFGGGALFFHLKPNHAIINDISPNLIEYYNLIKKQDKQLYNLLLCYNNSFTNLFKICTDNYDAILNIYYLAKQNKLSKNNLHQKVNEFINMISNEMNTAFTKDILLDYNKFNAKMAKMVLEKIQRTIKNDERKLFSENDLKNNLLTGFTNGYYMYFRDVFNDLELERIKSPSIQYKIANYYFIREYCYGSMFRYNSKGEFNVPYGGISYNTKNFKTKINNMFNKETETVFKNTDIHCSDFEKFFKKLQLTKNDFIFIDPPYDTDFSNYDDKDFDKHDQERLACFLKNIPAQFILVIKNTEFIYNLYKNKFNIVFFDNQYMCNMRSRNKRDVEHLIITNFAIN